VADFNTIQRGELQQRLSRGLGINERAPAASLASDVQAVVLLEDLTKQTPFVSPVDRRFFGGSVAPPVAAEFSVIAIQNPTGSGVVAVIRKVRFRGTANPITFGRLVNAVVTGTALAAAPVPADSRLGPTSALQARVGSNAIPLAPTPMFVLAMSNTVTAPEHEPNVVILPGESWIMEGGTVNLPCDAFAEWVEFTA
jgi:hypothetical protein